jgi:hypothetical protein
VGVSLFNGHGSRKYMCIFSRDRVMGDVFWGGLDDVNIVVFRFPRKAHEH